MVVAWVGPACATVAPPTNVAPEAVTHSPIRAETAWGRSVPSGPAVASMSVVAIPRERATEASSRPSQPAPTIAAL